MPSQKVKSMKRKGSASKTFFLSRFFGALLVPFWCPFEAAKVAAETRRLANGTVSRYGKRITPPQPNMQRYRRIKAFLAR